MNSSCLLLGHSSPLRMHSFSLRPCSFVSSSDLIWALLLGVCVPPPIVLAWRFGANSAGNGVARFCMDVSLPDSAQSILNQSVTSLSIPGKWCSDSFRDPGILGEGVQVPTNDPFARGHFHPWCVTRHLLRTDFFVPPMLPFVKTAIAAGEVLLPGVAHLGFKSFKIAVWKISEFRELAHSGSQHLLLCLGAVFYSSSICTWGMFSRDTFCTLSKVSTCCPS